MKQIGILSIIVIVILVIGYFFIGNYFYNFALNPEKEKEFLADNPHLAESEVVSAAAMEEREEKNSEFLKEHGRKDLVITSDDGLVLNSYLYEHEEKEQNWAIVVHGYSGNSTQMTSWVRNFYEQGYNVLTPDLRGHGKSEGHYIGMGWDDRKDILLWINEILKIDPDANIALFGISMGGATVMMTSGEDELPSNVKVIVEDCGYTSVMDIFTYQLKDLFNLPKFPVMNAANTVTNIRAGYDLDEASAIKQVAKSKTPMLFIHGDADTFVPYSMLDEVYNAAKVEKERLVIPGAGHGDAEKVDPETYWTTVWGFVDRYIPRL